MVGCQEVGTDRGLGGREVSAPVATPSHTVASLKARATCNPSLRQVALRSERCAALSHLPVPLFQTWSGLTAIGDLCRYCRPLGRIVFARKPLATVRVPCCPRSRVAPCWPAPGGLRRVHAGACKKVTQSCPPQSHSRLAFCAAQHRVWLRYVKDPSLPQAGPFTTNVFKFSLFLLAFLK
jgi:hypothetical protein